MTEAVGVGVSLASLAALFSPCIECFGYNKAGKLWHPHHSNSIHASPRLQKSILCNESDRPECVCCASISLNHRPNLNLIKKQDLELGVPFKVARPRSEPHLDQGFSTDVEPLTKRQRILIMDHSMDRLQNPLGPECQPTAR